MNHFVIASHGNLSMGMQHSAQMILGELENVDYIVMEVDTSRNKIKEKIEEIFNNNLKREEFIILTDILGGSITNVIAEYLSKERVHVITGVNLPLIIELITTYNSGGVDTENFEEAISHAQSGIVYLNSILTEEQTEGESI